VPSVPDEVGVTVVTMVFDAADPVQLVPVLAKYVVVSRGADGCRNIDLCASATRPDRFVVIEKWSSPEACVGLLTVPPVIDLLEGISAHDLN
jgi:quinol monooxygenase YgiN